MKYAFAAVALAALAQAQTRNDIPSCALPCIDDAIKSTSSCSTSDYPCVCKTSNFNKIQGAATSCVISKCGADVATSKVLPAVAALCKAQGSGGSGGSSSAAAQSSMAQSSAAESSMMQSSAAATSMASATTAAATTGSMTTPMMSSMSGGGAAGSTGTATTPAAVPTAGAASVGSMGGLVMLALGAFAL